MRSTLKFKGLSLIVGSLACFALPAAAASRDTLADCQKFVDGWRAAYNAHDAQAVAALYDARTGQYSNAFWTAAGRPTLTGAFTQEFATNPHLESIACSTSLLDGHLNFATGSYVGTAKGPGGSDLRMEGHWASLALLRNGKFLILNHISNLQMPPPGKP